MKKFSLFVVGIILLYMRTGEQEKWRKRGKWSEEAGRHRGTFPWPRYLSVRHGGSTVSFAINYNCMWAGFLWE